MRLVAPQVLRLGLVSRPADEDGELRDVVDIVALRVLAELADVHVLDHPLPQRADG